MPSINCLSNRDGSGTVTIPKDELEMCGLVDDNGAPDTDVQLLITMERPGEWRVTVVDDSRVDASWHSGSGAPETGVRVGSSGGGR